MYKISLPDNFRSKKSITDFANILCEALFKKDFYGLPFDVEDRLCAHNNDSSPEDVELVSGLKTVEEEASFCASKIAHLINSGYQVFDKKINAKRNVKFGDIAILLRKEKNIAQIYERALRQLGIPAITGKTGTLFDEVEVNQLVSMLAVINDPYRDLDLLAVMLSDIYAFDENEIASIRAVNKKKSLYENCLDYAEKDEKTAAFLRDLEYYSLLSENITVDRIVWRIINETGFINKVSCGKFGYIHRETLLKFYEFTKKYADSFSGSLFRFLNFIESSRDKISFDMKTETEGDFVRIMSCHKSKGLEFPVCIISSVTGKGNNDTTIYGYNLSLGFASERLLLDGRIRKRTFHSLAVKELNDITEKAELMRLLYVAVTRARDKLIIVGGNYSPKDYYGVGKVPSVVSLYSGNFGKLISDALQFFDSNYSVKEASLEEADSFNEEKQTETVIDIDKVKENMAFSYDRTLSEIPAKISVTELVKNRYKEDSDGELLISSLPTVSKPNFIEERQDGAFYGTAMHKFLSFAELEGEFEEEKARLVREKLLSEKEAAIIRRSGIQSFLRSDVYKLIKGANNLFREEDFVVSVPAEFYDKKAGKEDFILLQGAMDLLAEYEDGFVLLDYKTDNKTEQELIDKYAYQLYLYSLAAEKMFGKPVKKAYIWSFKIEKAIDITPFFPEIT